MAEYIEKEEIVTVLRDVGTRISGVFGVICYSIAKLIEKIPAADVRHVVRGRWEYNPGDNIPYCSECMMPQDSECYFCPNCGADMREES